MSEEKGVLTLEKNEGGTDYVLDENATSCWITVGNISVYIVRSDMGVAVDLFPLHREGGNALGSTWALNTEGEPDEEPWCCRPQIP